MEKDRAIDKKTSSLGAEAGRPRASETGTRTEDVDAVWYTFARHFILKLSSWFGGQLPARAQNTRVKKVHRNPSGSCPSPLMVILALIGSRPTLLPLQPPPGEGGRRGEDSLAMVTHSAGL